MDVSVKLPGDGSQAKHLLDVCSFSVASLPKAKRSNTFAGNFLQVWLASELEFSFQESVLCSGHRTSPAFDLLTAHRSVLRHSS